MMWMVRTLHSFARDPNLAPALCVWVRCDRYCNAHANTHSSKGASLHILSYVFAVCCVVSLDWLSDALFAQANVEWFIPNRLLDGYAFGEHSIVKAKEVCGG